MADEPTAGRHLAPPTPPGWVLELLDVLDHRRVMVMRTALGILLLGVLVAAFAPGVLDPSPVVGLLVGLAAAVIAAAIAFALDAADPVIRGGRHVRATGGEVLVEGWTTPDTAKAVAARLDVEVATSETSTYGFVALGADPALAFAMCEAIAEDLAVNGHRVLLADVSEASEADGIAEVVSKRVPLSKAVQFAGSGVTLARIGAGRDLEHAQRSFPRFLSGLPSDIDAVCVVLPATMGGRALEPEGLQRVFPVAVAGVSRRVDLTTAMEDYDTGTRAVHVLLVDPRAGAADLAPVPPLATEAVVDPLVSDDIAAEPPTDEPVPGLDLDVADPSAADEGRPEVDAPVAAGEDLTAPIPRVAAPAEVPTDATADDDGDAAAGDDTVLDDTFLDDPAAKLAEPDDTPRPKPLSPELAARLRRQQERQAPAAPEAPVVPTPPIATADEPPIPTGVASADVEEPEPVDLTEAVASALAGEPVPAPAQEPVAEASTTVEPDAASIDRPAEPDEHLEADEPDEHRERDESGAAGEGDLDLDPDLLAAALAAGELDALGEADPDADATEGADAAEAAEGGAPGRQGPPMPPRPATPGAPGGPTAGGLADLPPPTTPAWGGEQASSEGSAPTLDDGPTARHSLDASNALGHEPAEALDGDTQVLVRQDLPDLLDLTRTTFTATESATLDAAVGRAYEEDDDDPLGMTAALHSFTLERMGDARDDRDEDDEA